MVGFFSTLPFSHSLDFDGFHVMDQDIANFSMLSMIYIAIHDPFIPPCDHVDPYMEELGEDTYWPFLNHKWEEKSPLLP